jgi:hypothetical protein
MDVRRENTDVRWVGFHPLLLEFDFKLKLIIFNIEATFLPLFYCRWPDD